MKVRLYESQLERDENAGSRPITAQVSPRLFAQLGGAAADIGSSLIKLGAEKLKYDKANEELDAKNKASVAVNSFIDEAKTKIRQITTNNDPTAAHTLVPDALGELFNKYNSALSDNKKAQTYFGVDALRHYSDLKHKFLDDNITKKIDLGIKNIDTAVNNDISIAGDAGGNMVSRLAAADDAISKINAGKDVNILNDGEHKIKLSELNMNLVKQSLTSFMNGSNDPLEVAEMIEDGELISDIVFLKFYKKLTLQQKEKINEFAKKKAYEIDKLQEAIDKKDSDDLKEKVTLLKKQFYNTDDDQERRNIYDQIKEMNAFDSLKERSDFEKQLENNNPEAAIGFADNDSKDAIDEIYTLIASGNMSQSLLADNYRNKLTVKTYASLLKDINQDNKEDETQALKEMKEAFGIFDGYENVLEPSIIKAMQASGGPFIEKFYKFQRTNPSKNQIDNFVTNAISQFQTKQKDIYKSELKIELKNINKKLGNNKIVKNNAPNWTINNDDPVKSLEQLLNALENVQDAGVSGLRNRIMNSIETIEAFEEITND